MSGPDNYFLTVIAPIDYVRGGPQQKLRELENYLDNMYTSQPFESEDSRREVPFAVMPMVHMVRFLIIDEIPVQMGNVKSGQLASKYLMFVAELDGDCETFLKTFFREREGVATGIFEKCIGFPVDCKEHQFLRYIRQYEVNCTLPFSAYPSTTQPQVQNMLGLRAELTRFVADHQVSSPEDLHADWQRFIDKTESLGLTPLEARQTRRTNS